MEIMSKEEYLKKMAETLLRELRRTIYCIHMAQMPKGSEEIAMNKACANVIELLGLEGHDGEIEAIVDNNDFDSAYEEYLGYSEPYHDYEVNISVNYAASVHVKAKSEDEAKEYVRGNLFTNSTEVYMEDDENVIEDIDTGVDYAEWELENICDCGEYEE